MFVVKGIHYIMQIFYSKYLLFVTHNIAIVRSKKSGIPPTSLYKLNRGHVLFLFLTKHFYETLRVTAKGSLLK